MTSPWAQEKDRLQALLSRPLNESTGSTGFQHRFLSIIIITAGATPYSVALSISRAGIKYGPVTPYRGRSPPARNRFLAPHPPALGIRAWPTKKSKRKHSKDEANQLGRERGQLSFKGPLGKSLLPVSFARIERIQRSAPTPDGIQPFSRTCQRRLGMQTQTSSPTTDRTRIPESFLSWWAVILLYLQTFETKATH